MSIDRLKPAFMDEPLQDAPIVCDGARSVQTREPTSVAVKPHPIVSDAEPDANPVVTASGRLVKGALYRIQILCRRYTFWSYPAGLTIADPPG